MPQRIEFEGKVHEFPDDFTPSDIRRALLSAQSATPAAPTPPSGGLGRGLANRLLSTLPAAGATAGGIIGGGGGAIAIPGVGGVPGAMAGGTMGAMAGRALERGIRSAAGLPQPQGIAEMLGASVPAALQPTADIAEQGLLGGGFEGIGPGLFGIPGRGAGALERGACGVARRASEKAGRIARERVRAVAGARDIGPELKAAEEATHASRSAAGRAAAQAIERASSKPGAEITVKDIVDHVLARQEEVFGAKMPTKQVVKQVKDRLRTVLSEHSMGAIPGNQNVLRLGEANFAKRAFQFESRATYGSAARGVTPKPKLDAAIADALKQGMEKHVPKIEELNRQTARAIREHQDVRRMVNASRGPVSESLRQLRSERVASALANLPGGASMGIHIPGLPPGLPAGLSTVQIPAAGRLAAGASRLLSRPGVISAGRYSPDILNALVRGAGAPADVSNQSGNPLLDQLMEEQP